MERPCTVGPGRLPDESGPRCAVASASRGVREHLQGNEGSMGRGNRSRLAGGQQRDPGELRGGDFLLSGERSTLPTDSRRHPWLIAARNAGRGAREPGGQRSCPLLSRGASEAPAADEQWLGARHVLTIRRIQLAIQLSSI